MKPNAHSIKNLKGNKILIIVECLSGAMKASRFALKHIYNENDEIILLQIYKVQGLGSFMMRNLSHILKETALTDLSILKKMIIEEFGTPPKNIQKMVYEEDLGTTLKRKQFIDNNLIVLIGEDQKILQHKVSHQHILTVLKALNKHTTFYVEDNITIINRSKIIVISEDLGKIDSISKNFLNGISRKYGADIEYQTETNMKKEFNNGKPLLNFTNDNGGYALC